MALLTNINGKFSVSDAGAVTFNNAFTFPTADGAANYILKTDGGGQLSWVTDGGGNVTGSGTLNKVPRWTATGSNLGDGPITFSNASATATSTFGGPVTSASVYGTSRVQSDDNMFMVGGQFYIGADDSSTNDTYRFYAASGVYYLQSRKSGTWTTYLSIGSDAHAAFSGQVSATHFDSTSTTANIFLGSVITKPGDNLGFIVRNSTNAIIGSLLRTSNTTSKLTTDNLSLGGTTAQYVRGDGSFATYSGGGGTVTGTGTANTMPVWTSASALGNSIITQPSTGVVRVSGNSVYFSVLDTSAAARNIDIGHWVAGQTNIESAGGILSIGTQSNHNIVFETNGSTKATILANGNVGIGATNVEGRLDVRMNFLGQNWVPDGTSAKWAQVWDSAGTPGTYFDDVMLHVDTNRNGSTTGGVVGIAFSPGWQGHQNWGIYSINTGGGSYSSGDLIFTSQLDNGNIFERVRFQGVTGNVGIGVTSPTSKLTVGNGDIELSDTGYANVPQLKSTAFSSGGRYVTGAIKFDEMDNFNGEIQFWTTPTSSGYANANANHAQRMVITQDGKVGIGNTSPTYQLDVLGSGGNGGIIHVKNTDAQQYPRLAIQSDVKGYHIGVGGSGAAAGYTNDLYFYDNNESAIRMRIASSGQIVFPRTGQPPITNSLYGNIVLDSNAVTNFQRIRYDVGTTAYWGLTRLNTGNFAITGGSAWNDHAFELQYATQHVQINESIGQRRLNVYDATDAWIRLYCGSVADWIFGSNGSDHAFKWYNQSSNGGAGYKMQIDTAGALTVSGDVVAYGSPSDKRLKENIKPIESALDKVSKLQGVTFDWKESDSILNIKEDIGFIAQDVQKVIPELVRENEDGMLSMRHQGIAPILLEAIKELKTEIEELKFNKCNCK